MNLPSLPSGLGGLITDTREFLAAIRFTRPEALALLFLFILFAAGNRYAAARRRRSAEAIGRASAVASLQTRPFARRRWLGLAYPLAWLALVLAIAGPRWGKSDEPGVAVGRDLVVVVDLSQSMLANDMANADAKTRWEAARAGLEDLMTAIARRGGHRVGIVVFAARAKVVLPLTTDYDHIRAAIAELDANWPPPEIRPGADPNAVSGTRIGAGLLAAVQTHDDRFRGSQDILLLSDGDDPGDDREWMKGAEAARTANIPVHVVGIGNPLEPTLLTLGEELVNSKLEEDGLKRIAAETRGEYLPARRDIPRLGEFFRSRIEPYPSREFGDDAIPQPKDRSVWFLAAALCLFSLGWFRGR